MTLITCAHCAGEDPIEFSIRSAIDWSNVKWWHPDKNFWSTKSGWQLSIYSTKIHQADMTDKKLAKLHHSSHVQSAMRPHHGRSRGVLRRDHHWRSPDGGSSLKERNFGYCTCGCFQSVCFEFKVLLEFLFQRVNILFWNKWTHFRGRKICCSIPPCKVKCWRCTHEPFWSFHSRSWP